MSKIYLCKPGGVVLGTLTGIDENTASLKQSVSDTWELTFEVGRYQSVDGKMEETTYYQSLAEMMELFVDDVDGKGVYFQIDAEPDISGDGIQETKNVTAHSIECELSTKMLHNFKINCGVQDSQEYLVGKYDANGEFINKNINPVTKLPIDYIVVKNTYATKIQNLLDKINDSTTTGWVDTNTGYIYPTATFSDGEAVYPVLQNFFEECPRIYVDVQDDGAYQTYLNVVDNSSNLQYGYDVYICSSYTTIDDSIYDNYIVQLEALVRNKDKWIDPAEWQAEYDRISNELENYVQQQYQKDYSITRLKTGLTNLISYYTEYGTQLSLIDLAIENAKTSGWEVDDIPDTVASKKFQFNIESQDILSFLKSDCTKAMKVLFDFDRFNRKVSIIDVENDDEANDTGVFLTYRNLINNVNVKTSSNDGIRTKFLPTGQNNLGITQVNFGENNIINLDWFIDQVDEYGNLQYVSPEIANQYKAWQRFRDKDEIDVIIGGNTLHDTRRNLYTELTRMYNTKLREINDEMNRLPYNDCEIDFKKYTLAELNVAYKAYTNAFDAIQEAYKNEVHADTFDIYTLETTPSTCTKITDTIYWNDFICYRDTILPNVLNALKIYVYTDDGAYEELSIYHDGSPFDEYGRPTTPQQWDSKKEEWVCYPGGNPKYNKNAEVVTENESEAYVYDMTLYGPAELQAKINAWIEVAGVQYKKGFVLKQEGSKWVVIDPPPVNFYDYTVPKDGYKFNTADEKGWKLLGEEVQSTFTDIDAYINYLNGYLDYTSLDVRENKILKKQSRGIIPVAWDKLQELNQEIEIMERDQEDIQTARQNIAKEVTLENYLKAHDPNYELTLKTLTTMMREASYNNNNILTTNLDDIVTAIDKQEELYQDTQIALSEKSQPQLSFEIELDNLYALDEYKNLQDSIDLLKYIRVSRGLYEDNFVKLRVIGITRNPVIPTEELTLEFSNMTYNNQGASDFAHLFDDLAGGGSSSGSGGSGSGSSGTYGTNDAEITITNNLLNALLRSKSYTQAVGSTLLGQLSTDEGYARVLAQTGLFSQLEAGEMLINGKCLVDHIQSRNYSDVEGERAGSKLMLDDGTFDFAGGNLTYDGETLHVVGDIEVKDFDQKVEAVMSADLSSKYVEGKTLINGTHVITGTLSAKTIKGDTLKLGGKNGGENGDIKMYNSSDVEYGHWNVTSFKPNANAEFKADGKFTLGNSNYYIDFDGSNVQMNVQSFSIGSDKKALGTAAFKDTGAFDSAGAAAGVKSSIESHFKYDNNGVHVYNTGVDSGYNVLINSSSIQLRNAREPYITLNSDGIEVKNGTIKASKIESGSDLTFGNVSLAGEDISNDCSIPELLNYVTSYKLQVIKYPYMVYMCLSFTVDKNNISSMQIFSAVGLPVSSKYDTYTVIPGEATTLETSGSTVEEVNNSNSKALRVFRPTGSDIMRVQFLGGINKSNSGSGLYAGIYPI